MKARQAIDILCEAYADYGEDRWMADYEDTYEGVQHEWQTHQKHQSWKLVPAALLKSVWMQYGKYGRVDEGNLEKIWEIVRTNAIKIGINSDIKDGHDAVNFFQPGRENDDGDWEEGTYHDVPEEDWERWFLFVSDGNKNSPGVRNFGEVNGNARYSDNYKGLANLVTAAYRAKDGEARLGVIDRILNYVHGMGAMASWFVEGGVSTLDQIADYAPKGATMGGWQ